MVRVLTFRAPSGGAATSAHELQTSRPATAATPAVLIRPVPTCRRRCSHGGDVGDDPGLLSLHLGSTCCPPRMARPLRPRPGSWRGHPLPSRGSCRRASLWRPLGRRGSLCTAVADRVSWGLSRTCDDRDLVLESHRQTHSTTIALSYAPLGARPSRQECVGVLARVVNQADEGEAPQPHALCPVPCSLLSAPKISSWYARVRGYPPIWYISILLRFSSSAPGVSASRSSEYRSERTRHTPAIRSRSS